MTQARVDAKLVARGAATYLVSLSHLFFTRQQHTRYKDGGPESQFIPPKEETKIERNASEARLADAQHHPHGDEHRVRRGDGLQGRRESPGQHHHGHKDVGGDELPQERHPLKGNVRDVECRQRPLVPVIARGVGLEVLVHACYASVADIYSDCKYVAYIRRRDAYSTGRGSSA